VSTRVLAGQAASQATRKRQRVHAESAPAGEPAQDKEFMSTLAKGFAVLRLFGRERPSLTLSEAAAATELSRATARRILRTLTSLGYVEQRGRLFSLAPGILNLGFSYLSAQSWIERARPLMKELSERFHESCSAAILQETEVAYVARVPAGRIMSVAISIGTRLPAFHTSIGRAQLGFLDDEEIWRRLRSLRIEPYTPSTIIDLQALFERIRADREQGFSIVDEELERGLRSIAVPIVDRTKQAIAALNLSTHSTRTTRNEMRERFLPALRGVSDLISVTLP
jgi:IclR family transcriptional regulator, pca regulon regulatory protein